MEEERKAELKRAAQRYVDADRAEEKARRAVDAAEAEKNSAKERVADLVRAGGQFIVMLDDGKRAARISVAKSLDGGFFVSIYSEYTVIL